MAATSDRRRIWGWWAFDWASQPYATLLLTFIFGPYVTEVLGDGSRAQAAWGYGVGAAGLVIAVLAPLLGAVADRAGQRMRFIWMFSALYVIGSAGLWLAQPGDFNLVLILTFFAIGLVGLQFTTIFTDSMLADLGTKQDLGRISGTGWAIGYVGGVLALAIMLVFFAENARTGTTLIGLSPALGLDPEAREGTRFVGPFTALWYVIFMIPFFLWVQEPRAANRVGIRTALRHAVPDLHQTLRRLPGQRSLFAYLASSMFYRDALSAFYVFGGTYAAGVLGWSVTDVGVFGILAAITGAIAAWVGGHIDSARGPKPVITSCVVALSFIALGVVFVSREAVFGIPVTPDSRAPDIAFYVLGAGIGAFGGVLGAASRTMMVRQADPNRMTEAFGLYALAGKATAFVAPLSVGFVTDVTDSQQAGISVLILLFLVGLVLLAWVKPDGERAAWSEPSLP